MTRAQRGAFPSALSSVTKVIVYGNSIPAGAGVFDLDKDLMTRFSQMIGAREVNYAKGGSVMIWPMDVANGRFGTYPMIAQTHRRKLWGSSTIATTDPGVGATQVTVAADPSNFGAPVFTPEQQVHVGTGDTGATGGEVITLGNKAGLVLNVKQNEALSGGTLLRDHAIGDPIYQVPTQYNAANVLYLLCEAHNFLGWYKPNATSEAWYKHTLRSCLARLRSAELYEPDHSANQFTGTWGAATSRPDLGSGTAGVAAQGVRQPTATNSEWIFHVPNNWDGGTAFMTFVSALTAAATVEFYADGVLKDTLTIPACPTTPAAYSFPVTYRFRGLAPGRHKLVAKVTALGTGAMYADVSGLEARRPPKVGLFKAHRLGWYHNFFLAAYTYGHIKTTIAGAAPGGGATTVRVAQTTALLRQISTSIPTVGETITLNPGTASEQKRSVNGAPSLNGGNWDIPITPALSSGASIGDEVQIGVQDADLPTVNAWIDTVADEFDKYVRLVNLDPYIHNGPLASQKRTDLFLQSDGVHLDEEGQSEAALGLFEQLLDDTTIDHRLTARMAQPASPLPSKIQFLATGVAVVWTNMIAALSEFPLTTAGPGNFRRYAELSKAYEARLIVVQTVVGSAGSKMRVQFSLDGGTTWYYLTRKVEALTSVRGTDFTQPTLATDLTMEIDLGAALPADGTKRTDWFPIYADALTKDVALRLTGIGGNATADPAFMAIEMEYR